MWHTTLSTAFYVPFPRIAYSRFSYKEIEQMKQCAFIRKRH
jgi:hypothetical protein